MKSTKKTNPGIEHTQVVDPAQRAVFLDTDACSAMAETAFAETVANGGEAALLVRIAAALVAAGLPAGDIGALSPYRAQACCLGFDTPPKIMAS